MGVLLYTIGWLSLHFLSGAYSDIYHKSTVIEFLRTLIVSLIGCLGLLFFFILKNPHENNFLYYEEFYSLLIPVFLVTLLSRLLLLHIANKQLKQKKVFFNVLLVGSGKNASQFFESFTNTNAATGYSITSFLNTNGNNNIGLPASIKKYNDAASKQDEVSMDSARRTLSRVHALLDRLSSSSDLSP